MVVSPIDIDCPDDTCTAKMGFACNSPDVPGFITGAQFHAQHQDAVLAQSKVPVKWNGKPVEYEYRVDVHYKNHRGNSRVESYSTVDIPDGDVAGVVAKWRKLDHIERVAVFRRPLPEWEETEL